MSGKSDGPYMACHTSKDEQPYAYGVSGPGNGIGFYAWLGHPENTFDSFEAAEQAARLMNLAFAQGKAARSREIRELIG